MHKKTLLLISVICLVILQITITTKKNNLKIKIENINKLQNEINEISYIYNNLENNNIELNELQKQNEELENKINNYNKNIKDLSNKISKYEKK